MISLAFFDLIYLISSLLIFAVPIMWPDTALSSTFAYSIPFLLPAAHIGLTGKFNY